MALGGSYRPLKKVYSGGDPARSLLGLAGPLPVRPDWVSKLDLQLPSLRDIVSNWQRTSAPGRPFVIVLGQ